MLADHTLLAEGPTLRRLPFREGSFLGGNFPGTMLDDKGNPLEGHLWQMLYDKGKPLEGHLEREIAMLLWTADVL